MEIKKRSRTWSTFSLPVLPEILLPSVIVLFLVVWKTG